MKKEEEIDTILDIKIKIQLLLDMKFEAEMYVL